jgi:hypothetical protein
VVFAVSAVQRKLLSAANDLAALRQVEEGRQAEYESSVVQSRERQEEHTSVAMHCRGRLVPQDGVVVHPREWQVECELVAVEHMEHWDVLEGVDVWQRKQSLGVLGIREESSQMRCVETEIR